MVAKQLLFTGCQRLGSALSLESHCLAFTTASRGGIPSRFNPAVFSAKATQIYKR